MRAWPGRVAVYLRHGYTKGMKTAVSIPDEIFEQAEELARRLKKSRSELYREALAEYVARRNPEVVREALDRVVASLDGADGDFVGHAALRVLERSEW